MKRLQKTDDSKSIITTTHTNQKIGRVLSILLVVSALMSLPISGSAETKKYVLDFNDRYMDSQKGEPTTLQLKRMLARQYPWVNTRTLKLRDVILVAKSKIGRGHAQLRVGRQTSDIFRVAGHPKKFRRDHQRSFDRIHLYNPAHSSWGPWQMNLKGTFKVRRIILTTENKSYRHRDYYSRY